ncbi:MAG TPA: glutamate racemase [Candidatus Dormibacteraeota bacterium]|nr:glutamate racemase [Candidatus Dormibacteraeota bacterium]
MIAIFDSGLGGLSVLRRVREAIPRQDVVYLGDQLRAPYGERTLEEIHAFAVENLAFLARQGADVIVMGCNTSCAAAQTYGWPTSLPVLDLFAAAGAAVAEAEVRETVVLATTATVRSGGYARAIAASAPRVRVREVACPEFVPLVEAGLAHSPQAREAVARVVRGHGEPESIVYGCTHYPFLESHLRALLPTVRCIDPAIQQARNAAQAIRALGLPEEPGEVRLYTTGDVEAFARQVEMLVGPAGIVAQAPLAGV